MMSNNKIIHTLNSSLLDLLDEFGTGDVSKDINSILDDLKTELNAYGIKYDDLRSCLNPSANVYAFVFNTDYIKVPFYGQYLNDLVYKSIDKKIRCTCLAGDLIINSDNFSVYVDIFKKNGVDPNLLEKNNFYVICIINISEYAFAKICEELKSRNEYVFGFDITVPSLDKYALTYYLPQKFIKFGSKIIYGTPESSDTGNYSGLSNEDIQLCPILEYNYLTFLQNNPIQIIGDFKDLKYVIKAFFNIEIMQYPQILISNEKYQYVYTHIGIKCDQDKLVDSIEKAVKSNQIYHISKNTFEVDECLNINVVIWVENRKYQAAVKWKLRENTLSLITITR